MKVPINPTTDAPAGQLGYEKPVDVTAGTRALASVISDFADYTDKERKKRELFDVQKRLVDETNNLATDFDAKKTAQPLGAPNFVKQVGGEYNTRHMQMVQELKDQGYSTDAVNEFATRLGAIRSQYIAQAIDFESKSNHAKVHNDSQQMVISLSQYAGKNPNAIGSALDEYRVSLTHSGLDQIEQQQLYDEGRPEILQAARDGFVLQHPDAVVQLFDPQHVVTSTANSPDGTATPITTSAIKPNGQLADNIVAGLKNRGLPDHLARGIAAGIYAESGNDPNASNSSGGGEGAHYLGQWRGPRLAALHKQYGPHPTGSQQLDFLVSELHGGDAGGKAVLSQADEVSVLHSYINDFMRPSAAGAKGDISRGLAALGRKVTAHAEVTATTLIQPVPGRSYNVEDAIQELGMTADQAQEFVKTGKDTRTQTALAAATPPALGFDDQGKTGIPALDMATEAERFQMLTQARVLVNEHQADAKTAQHKAHDDWYNSFLNDLQDGKLGQSDLNAALSGGQITDFDERKKAQGILDEKNKKNDSLLMFHTMLSSGQKFNPYDDNAQKAADAGFEHTLKFAAKNKTEVDPFVVALQIWNRTGILPKQGAVMIRGGLVGTDPQQVASAASVANNMIRQNPNAFAGADGQADIEHAAVAYGHYIYDLGMSPQEAANKVATENDPKFKEKFKYNDPATQAAVLTLRQNGVNAAQAFHGASFPNQDTLNEANQTYYELIRDQLNRGVNLGSAMSQANAQMQKVYGPNSNNRIVKYPPERGYPSISGSWNYIYHDAQKTVKDETGRDPIHVNLAPIPGVTDEDFRRGRLPRYRIIYSYKAGDQTVVDSVPGEFAADIGVAAKNASAKDKKDFTKEREAQINTQRLIEQGHASALTIVPGLSPTR